MSNLFLMLAATLIHPNVVYGQTFCHQSLQCANQSTIVTGNGTIWNNGYKSHYGSLSSLSTADTIKCHGAFSCAKASLIIASDISCGASFSCSNVLDLHLHPDNPLLGRQIIFGAAVAAIAYTSIHYPSRICNSQGEQALAHSVITGWDELRVQAAYGIFNATIDSIHGPSTPQVHLRGYYAAYGATFICRTGQNCSFHCYTSTACTNVKLICDNNCIIHEKPFTTTSLPLHDIFLYDALDLARQNDAACSAQSDTMNFDNFEEKYMQNIVVDQDIGGPVCCRAYQSCKLASIQYNTSRNSDGIVCSGKESCLYSNINISSNDSPVFCEGYGSCRETNITTSGKIYCNGFYACPFSFFYGASHVYCAGWLSCPVLHVSSNGADLQLYLTGYNVVNSGTVICSESDHCSIFCYGQSTCGLLTLICDGTCSVSCDEDSACPIGWVSGTPTETATANPSASPFPIDSSNWESTPIATNHLSTLNPKTMLVTDTSNVLLFVVLVGIASTTTVLIVYCIRKCYLQWKNNMIDVDSNHSIAIGRENKHHVEMTYTVEGPQHTDADIEDVDEDKIWNNNAQLVNKLYCTNGNATVKTQSVGDVVEEPQNVTDEGVTDHVNAKDQVEDDSVEIITEPDITEVGVKHGLETEIPSQMQGMNTRREGFMFE
eukprot:83878_1